MFSLLGEINFSFAHENTINSHYLNKANHIPVTEINQVDITRIHKTKNHFISFFDNKL